MRNPFPERCRRPLLFLGIPALMLACIIGTALVSRDNTVAQPIPEPVCNMDVTVIGYGELCADGMAQSPSPATHVCFTVAEEVVCVPLERLVVRRSL